MFLPEAVAVNGWVAAALGLDDDALGDEHVADVDGGLEHAAGVEPQVQDQGLHAFLFELVEDLSQVRALVSVKPVRRT